MLNFKNMKTIKEMSEKELREIEVPSPKTIEELNQYINDLTERQHDYGTCVYAMSMASLATFNYVAGKLGVTGFQASCADMDFLKRNRRMKEGFRIIDYNKLLYPQYFDKEHFPSALDLLEENRENLRKAAQKLIDESSDHVNPSVMAHWKKIAS